MTYEDICRYVFQREIVDWSLRTYKRRHRQLVQARQISIFLGNWFFPKMSDNDLAEPFAQDRCTALHAIKTIKGYLQYDKDFRDKMDNYLIRLSAMKKKPEAPDPEEEIFMEPDFFPK
jgi:chromosomal replication initiation ATPase DnaA